MCNSLQERPDLKDELDEENEDHFNNFYQEQSKKLPTTSVGATLEDLPTTYPTQRALSEEILKRIKMAFSKNDIPDISAKFKTFDFQVRNHSLFELSLRQCFTKRN